jgi:hypothetical protein
VYRNTLPKLSDEVFLTGSELVTDLVFNERFELPEFASFVLVDGGQGRAALEVYFRRLDSQPDLPPCRAAAPMRATCRPSQSHSWRPLAHDRHGPPRSPSACKRVRFGATD